MASSTARSRASEKARDVSSSNASIAPRESTPPGRHEAWQAKRVSVLAGLRHSWFPWMLAAMCSTIGLRAAGDTRVVDAVKAGRRDVLRTLLRQPGLVNVAEPDGTTALLWAVLADDMDTVRLLLSARADVGAANQYGTTPLSAAATNGNPKMIELLLAAGADAHAVLPEGETVVMTAARTGNADALKALLDYGADPNARERWYGETALIWAAAQNHAAAVRTLVEYGADVNVRSAATTVRRQGGQRGGWTPLIYAARQRAIDAIAALVDAGANLDATDSDGTTPLLVAILNAHYDVAVALLERGADPNLGDRTGMTPLYATLDVGALPVPFGRPDRKPTGPPDNIGLIAMLLEYGADPNIPLKSTIMQRLHTLADEVFGAGATPIMRAAKAGNLAAMHMLLDYGANPSTVQHNGTTTLMIAAGLGWRDGFPIRPPFAAIRDKTTESDSIEAIKLCLSLGADINAANPEGDTALHGAADARGSEAIIRFLVQHGARLDARNQAGQTPLDAAFAHRDRAGTLLRTVAVAALSELMGGAAPGADTSPR
jgi:uncharacterized protein